MRRSILAPAIVAGAMVVLLLAAIKVALTDPDGARELLATASERFPALRERTQEASVRLGLPRSVGGG